LDRLTSQQRLDVDNRGAIDGFDRSNSQPIPNDFLHGYGMEAQWIRSVRRARREDAREGKPLVTARVEAEHIAAGAVKPRHDDDLIADGDSVESFCE